MRFENDRRQDRKRRRIEILGHTRAFVGCWIVYAKRLIGGMRAREKCLGDIIYPRHRATSLVTRPESRGTNLIGRCTFAVSG